MKKTMLILVVMVWFLGIVMQAEAQTVTKKATTGTPIYQYMGSHLYGLLLKSPI